MAGKKRSVRAQKKINLIKAYLTELTPEQIGKLRNMYPIIDEIPFKNLDSVVALCERTVLSNWNK